VLTFLPRVFVCLPGAQRLLCRGFGGKATAAAVRRRRARPSGWGGQSYPRVSGLSIAATAAIAAAAVTANNVVCGGSSSSSHHGGKE